jgi:heme oxygenase
MNISIASPVSTGAIQKEAETLHRIARTTGFMRTLISGEASLREYGGHLFNQYIVYQSLEKSLEQFWFHPMVGSVYYPGLRRTPSLENDLEAVVGPNWRNLRALDSTEVYSRRLRELSRTYPGLLAAHAYVHYSDLLSGGTVLRQILAEEYNLDEEALHFYDFSHIADLPDFALDYREAVGLLPLQDQDKQEFINEIKLSFVLSTSISFEMEHRAQTQYGDEQGEY